MCGRLFLSLQGRAEGGTLEPVIQPHRNLHQYGETITQELPMSICLFISRVSSVCSSVPYVQLGLSEECLMEVAE